MKNILDLLFTFRQNSINPNNEFIGLYEMFEKKNLKIDWKIKSINSNYKAIPLYSIDQTPYFHR